MAVSAPDPEIGDNARARPNPGGITAPQSSGFVPNVSGERPVCPDSGRSDRLYTAAACAVTGLDLVPLRVWASSLRLLSLSRRHRLCLSLRSN